MFVLPPPQRYPTQSQFTSPGGAAPSPVELNNSLSEPKGPENEFLVGEGRYVLREELTLANPPPHPSEPVNINPNPLSTTPQPAAAETRVSLISLESKSSTTPFISAEITTSSENRPSIDVAGSVESTNGTTTAPVSAPAPAFGQGTLSQPSIKDAGKKRKPRSNMTKSSSSFISRVIVSEILSKRLQARPADGLFAFANIGRAMQWLDMSSPQKADYLTKILFTKAHCLCHDVNTLTKAPGHIDLALGFSTSDIIWWEPMTQRYSRLNKHGIINDSGVSEIRWIPGSESLFLAAHMDGSLVVYDKEKDDGALNPEDEVSSESSVDGSIKPLQILKSVHSKNQKTNPVASWKLSNQKINAFAFSPDSRHLAVVSEDGSLRIIDYLQEELLDHFYSYYGGLTCVCWSPDGRYILTGGQDDLISIWAVATGDVESTLVARCQGHQSWVTSVAFDPWRCDDRNYRFGSVGDDCRLCLWDFNVGMLYRPNVSAKHRTSISSSKVAPLQRANTSTSTVSRLDADRDSMLNSHPVEPRSTTAMLPPILSKIVDNDPASGLEFTENAIVISCKSGHIKTWNRPSSTPAIEPSVSVSNASGSAKGD